MTVQATRGRQILPWRPIGWGVIVALLITPLIAMQFDNDVNWTASDFVFAAVMMGGVGLVFELAVRATPNWAYRGGVAVALATAFLTIWINLAVGIIGSEHNPVNAVFFGVVAIAILGALIARFRAKPMAIAMTVAAAAQLTVAIVAAAIGAYSAMPIPLIFTASWLLSAWLFRTAARQLAAR